jgi:peptidoglycan/xylan/chitin deacetylase (PgdA/CDA1 family)
MPRLEILGGVHKRNIARFLYKRLHRIEPDSPLISFTFDDFPRTALQTGGEILKTYGLKGTFYVSLGCLGQDSPSGPLSGVEDVIMAVEGGHDLGCHTFSHCHSWDTRSTVYEQSVIQNQAALDSIVPGARFWSFAYPISSPRPSVKRAVSRHFACCREGGQKPNVGTVDLNQVGAYFLEKVRDDIQPVKKVIDFNTERRGWLVFATHDVAESHGPYGCRPTFLRDVVKHALQSGARILPVNRALEVLGVPPVANGRAAASTSPSGAAAVIEPLR